MIRLHVIMVLFCTLDWIITDEVKQPSPLLAAQVGDKVTLQCSYIIENQEYISWYKQAVGRSPQNIITLHQYSEPVFEKEFNAKRFSVQRGEGIIYLTILKTDTSDSGTYFCGKYRDYATKFEAGTFLAIIGSEEKSNSRTVVQQPVSDSVQPGDSVTLQCTIDTETCAGEHSVYWFRNGSGESLPGIIYTHGNRSDQCEKIPEAGSPTQSCVYNLPKRNLSLSDAGTYYCAVVTCGEILFGNGTKLDFEEKAINPFVLGLAAALVCCLTVILVLICTWNRKICCKHCTDASQQVLHDDSMAGTSGVQKRGDEMLNYAALNFADKKPNSRRKKREIKQESLYSGVRYTDLE